MLKFHIGQEAQRHQGGFSATWAQKFVIEKKDQEENLEKNAIPEFSPERNFEKQSNQNQF